MWRRGWCDPIAYDFMLIVYRPMFIFIGRDLGDVALHIFRSIKDGYTMVQLDYAFWGLSKFRRVTLNGGVKYKISYFRPMCRYISETT